MTIELDAGSESGEIPDGFTIPLANSEPNVNVDQILASLDGDTRAYLRLLLSGGAEALGTPQKSRNFSNVLRRLEPTTRDIAKINGAIAKRRDNLRHVITNFKLIAEELAKSDTNLTGFVDSQSKVFGAFADSQANLRETLRELPGALQATRGALGASATLSGQLKPALTELLPQAKALGPALRATRPFFRQTTPSIRDQLRPFTRDVSGVVADLKRASKPVAQSTAKTKGALTEVNQLVNSLAYNPPGNAEGYLFYLSWLNHNTNSDFLNQDGLGPVRRSVLMYTCFTSQLGDNVTSTRPNLKTARELIRLPTTQEICPALLKAPGKLDASPDGPGGSTTTDETTTDSTSSTTDSTSSTTTDSTDSTDSTGSESTDSTEPAAGGATSSTTGEEAP
jgi:phospholipid/cholesterol/gamma-HCH transport system substrate-binding protein